MKSFAVIVLLVLAGAAYAVYALDLLTPRKPPPPADTTIRAVAALGRICPDGGMIEVGADSTRRVSRLMVEEGQVVKKDDILAYLDNFEELQAATAYYEAQFQGGKTQLAFRTALEQANIAKAEAELKSVVELTPHEIAMQELTLDKHRLELALAQKELKRLEKLADKGSASREDVDRKTTEVSQRTVQVKSSEAELQRLKTAFVLNRGKAQAAVDSAKASLKFQEATIDLSSLGKTLEQARTRMTGAIVRAPADGQVLKIRSHPGEIVRNPGLLTMGNLRTMWVVAEVYENDLMLVREGQTAKVTAAALTEPLTGRVLKVSRLINRQAVFDLDPAAATDSRVAEVRIQLDRAELATRLVNLQVTVTIDVAEQAERKTP